jgi:hypothetical protein
VHVKVAELKAECVAASGGIIEESLGLVVQELTPAMARSLQVTDIKGLVVDARRGGGHALGRRARRGQPAERRDQRDSQAALGRVGSADSPPVLPVRPGGNDPYVALKMAKRGGSLSV